MELLFAASGSNGNASFIYDPNSGTLIQIDMGIPKKEITSALKRIGKSIEDIDALFLTHNHADHVSTVGLYHGAIPIYCSEGTLGEDEAFEIIEPGVGIEVGPFLVMPISASHDAPNPLNYIIYLGEEKLVYITDTGLIKEENLPLMVDADYYLFESNHDLRMLYTSHRPLVLKNRVAGDFGHLSNIDSAQYLKDLIGPKTKAIYLAHLSEECNTLEKALSTHKKVYGKTLKDKVKIVAMKRRTVYFSGDLS